MIKIAIPFGVAFALFMMLALPINAQSTAPSGLTYVQEGAGDDINISWTLPDQSASRAVVITYVQAEADFGSPGYYTDSYVQANLNRGLGYRNDQLERNQDEFTFDSDSFRSSGSWWAYDYTAGSVIRTTFPITLGNGTWNSLDSFTIEIGSLIRGATYNVQIFNCEVGSDGSRCSNTAVTIVPARGIGIGNVQTEYIDKFPGGKYAILIFAPIVAAIAGYVGSAFIPGLSMWAGIGCFFIAFIVSTIVLQVNPLIMVLVLVAAACVTLVVIVFRGRA